MPDLNLFDIPTRSIDTSREWSQRLKGATSKRAKLILALAETAGRYGITLYESHLFITKSEGKIVPMSSLSGILLHLGHGCAGDSGLGLIWRSNRKRGRCRIWYHDRTGPSKARLL